MIVFVLLLDICDTSRAGDITLVPPVNQVIVEESIYRYFWIIQEILKIFRKSLCERKVSRIFESQFYKYAIVHAATTWLIYQWWLELNLRLSFEVNPSKMFQNSINMCLYYSILLNFTMSSLIDSRQIAQESNLLHRERRQLLFSIFLDVDVFPSDVTIHVKTQSSAKMILSGSW